VVPVGAAVPQAPQDATVTELRLVPFGRVAAVVGTVPADRPLGRAADLVGHDRVLAQLVTSGTAVLPFRFGAVVTDEDAVVTGLLEPNHDEFAAALRTLDGRVQYMLKARYEQDAALLEVLERHPEIDALRRKGDYASLNEKIRLGELVVSALAEMRPGDAAALLVVLALRSADMRVHEPSEPDEVLNVAFLVDHERIAAFEQAVESVAHEAAGRIRIRLVGPVAAYDFVDER
jgi:hypothetical protein